jgi:hypothetical protein
MQDYRSAEVGTNVSSVTYYPNGRAGRVLWPLLLVAIFLVTSAMGVGSTRGVRLRCDHANATCNIESRWPIGSTSDVYPIASIRSTRLAKHTGKSSTTYGLVFVTASGDVELPGATASQSIRNAEKAQLDAFFADANAAAIDIDYAEPSGAVFFLVPFSLVWLLVGWLFSWYARVEVDWIARTFTVIGLRWPLAPKRRTFDLDRVRDARVVERRGSKGGRLYAVVLDVEAHDEVPLTSGSSSSIRPKEDAVQQIRALLARRDESAGKL